MGDFTRLLLAVGIVAALSAIVAIVGLCMVFFPWTAIFFFGLVISVVYEILGSGGDIEEKNEEKD